VNAYGAQESIPPGWESIPGPLKVYKYGLWLVATSIAAGIDSLESIHGLLKSLNILALLK
jgi:hypothetical protein